LSKSCPKIRRNHSVWFNLLILQGRRALPKDHHHSTNEVREKFKPLKEFSVKERG